MLNVVLEMPHYNVRNFELSSEIYRVTRIPVFIANDTRAWALAEKLFGHSQENNNSVLISIHNGLSAGVIVNGRVLQGRLGHIGDLGHIRIDPDGLPCHCGHQGCLETVASSHALRQQVLTRIAQGAQSSLSSLEDISIEDICMAASDGDPLACEVMGNLGKYLGYAIAIVINIFNPEKVLLGGIINLAKDVLYPPMFECIEAQTHPMYWKQVRIMESRFYKQSTMPGAALIKQALYDGSLLMAIVDR